MKLILIGLFAITIFLAGCGGNTGPTTCTSDSTCQSWQLCTNSTCTVRPGFCVADGDCSDNLTICDAASSHLCVFKEGSCRKTSDCQGWQVCDSEFKCRPAPGYCDADNQCDQPSEFCNPSKHQCGPAPGYCVDSRDCEAWKQCDITTKRCTLLDGKCDVDGDCESWQVCTIKTHICKAKVGFCISTEDCSAWTLCDKTTNKCIARQGYCIAHNECNDWELCSSQTHRCVPDKDRCNLNSNCGTWQVCDSSHYCSAKTGFCNTAADCVQGEQCNQQTHTCQ